MHIYTPILLLVLSALHGHADADPKTKSVKVVIDRLNYYLKMLRLGKRSDLPTEDSQYEDLSPEYLLALERISRELLQTPNDDEVSPQDYYKTLGPVQDSYGNARYRRSTPSDGGMVTPAPAVDLSGDDAELKIDDDDVDDYPYFLYPEFDDDGVIVDEEEGKVWDASTGEALSGGEYELGKGEPGMGDDSLDTSGLGVKRNLNMLRLGKRQLNMLRLGKRNLNMLRLGKRQLNMLRLGKRNLNMLRLGKRQLNMLRLGKRQLNMLRLGKRQLNMLRLGKREDETVKRNLQMLRLGKREDETVKRNLQMLRLGKREDETVKRNLQMLRLGKREDETVKRNLQMLRLGKREDETVKRNLQMLRLGKREDETAKRNLQMLRLGKREAAFSEKRNLNVLRLGKRSVETVQENKEE